MTDPTAARWRELYSAALFEGDDRLILDRIDAAELAIAARARELFSPPADDHVEEIHALDAARYALRALRGAVLLRRTRAEPVPLISLPTWPSGA